MDTAWPTGRLRLHPDVVLLVAWRSLRLRLARSLLTALTIATSSAFLTYLLTAPRRNDAADRQAWALLVALSLVVSAAGVWNAMLTSVTQRYREIGTMKCLGALDRFVLLSVLAEAALLGAAGSVAGLLAGGVLGIGLAALEFGRAWAAHMSLGGLGLKAAVVLTTGMALTTLGAIIPASVASRMPPMEAMRGEK
jgi:ABC-type lipoprotein release transport system permease subunit